jgi:hypothetical protein
LRLVEGVEEVEAVEVVEGVEAVEEQIYKRHPFPTLASLGLDETPGQEGSLGWIH